MSKLTAKGAWEKEKKKKGLNFKMMLRRSTDDLVPVAQVNTALLKQEGLKTRETNKLLKKLQQENYFELFVKGDKGHLQPTKSSDSYASPHEFIRFPSQAAPHIINAHRVYTRTARPATKFASELEKLLQRIADRYLHYYAKASNYRRFHSSEEFRLLFQWSMELQVVSLSPLPLAHPRSLFSPSPRALILPCPVGSLALVSCRVESILVESQYGVAFACPRTVSTGPRCLT